MQRGEVVLCSARGFFQTFKGLWGWLAVVGWATRDVGAAGRRVRNGGAKERSQNDRKAYLQEI
jgi:hypothetical protein